MTSWRVGDRVEHGGRKGRVLHVSEAIGRLQVIFDGGDSAAPRIRDCRRPGQMALAFDEDATHAVGVVGVWQ